MIPTIFERKKTHALNMLSDLGHSASFFFDSIIPVIKDLRIRSLSRKSFERCFSKPDGFNRYWTILEKETHRTWGFDEVLDVWNSMRMIMESQRKSIPVSHKLHMEIEAEKECYICGSIEELEIHHIMPVSLGGRNVLGNYVWCCSRCNKMIGNKVVRKEDRRWFC